VKLLIDECLHTSLIGLAQEAGHLSRPCHLSAGSPDRTDWQLMATIRQQGLHVCHQQSFRFSVRFGRERLHAGLIIIVPNVTPARQKELFRAALEHIWREGHPQYSR
jgi:predicted nuclease of predicted toxin-antitoxin system